MKSIVCYGEKDIRIEEREKPTINAGELAITVKAGGICGSDLHYYQHGGFGSIRLHEPMILGHEVCGRVAELGAEVSGLHAGDLVAINPSRPCGHCEYCTKAYYNHCLEMNFYGSAMRNPHVQGAFQQVLIVAASQCARLPEHVNPYHGAFAEPLAVALHAVKQAGSLMGKRVLITGSGPIGALVVAVAKLHGALEVVATDIVDQALQKAQNKGYFDVVIEASGAQAAILTAIDAIRPRGKFIQLGLGGDVTLPMQKIVSKEIEMKGSFRFHEEFFLAAEVIGLGRINLDNLLSAVFPVEQAVEAFERAGDRNLSMKVQIDFE
ncbi:MAG: L-idonate 5-dehydrogenase [Gammaproteobacteria bacterium]